MDAARVDVVDAVVLTDGVAFVPASPVVTVGIAALVALGLIGGAGRVGGVPTAPSQERQEHRREKFAQSRCTHGYDLYRIRCDEKYTREGATSSLNRVFNFFFAQCVKSLHNAAKAAGSAPVSLGSA